MSPCHIKERIEKEDKEQDKPEPTVKGKAEIERNILEARKTAAKE